MITAKEAIRLAIQYLNERNLRFPREDAEVILLSILGCDRVFLLTHPERVLSVIEEQVFHQWLCKRGEHYPLQYLRGVQEFYGREFEVTPAVLIPRPETELLVEAALHFLRGIEEEHLWVLEIGTGSGCIAVSLACEEPRVGLTVTDVSRGALDCARRNSEKHECLHRLEFLLGDALMPVVDRKFHYHLLVSNPPYVDWLQKDTVEPSVSRHEPREAVFSGNSGLDVYTKLLRNGRENLRRSGRLMVEIGYGAGEPLFRLADENGWRLAQVLKDLSGIERCAIFVP